MSKRTEPLDVVNEQDEIIGQETRGKVHEKGLLHREVHVWFFNDNGEILFQRRGQNVETYPGILDATVGGHVDLAETYTEAALKEVLEETGLTLEEADLIEIDKIRTTSFDEGTNITNNTFKMEYAYRFTGDPSTLSVEKDKGEGFEWWTLEDAMKARDEGKGFIRVIFEEPFVSVLRAISNLANE